VRGCAPRALGLCRPTAKFENAPLPVLRPTLSRTRERETQEKIVTAQVETFLPLPLAGEGRGEGGGFRQ
jgi:hypothetical protein